MKKANRVVIFLQVIVHFLPASTFAQFDKVISDMKDTMHQHSIIGVSVAVVKHNHIVYTRSFGFKNVEAKLPLSDTDIFRIASISKSFSAASIMQLAKEGKLSLNDDFSNLIGFTIRNPKYPDIPITLKMVLSHTSSINDSQDYTSLDIINPSKNPNYAKCYSEYAPGKGYKYCNLNYNMVGAVIERISGERFDNYVRHHILQPLGIYGGYCVDSLDASRFVTLYEYDSTATKFTPADMAYGSRREQLQHYVMGYSTPILSPTGGMKVSATSLAQWMMIHMGYGKHNGVRVISRKYSKLMQKKISEEEGYGMAMMNVRNMIYGQLLTGHTGTAYGLYSAMFFSHKKHFGIVAIINGCSPIYTDDLNSGLRAVVNCMYKDVVQVKN